MSRNAFGAAWARYHRERKRKRDETLARRKSAPCVYLLYKCHESLRFLGEPNLVIKFGKSERNALMRFSEQKRGGFVLKKDWEVPAIHLAHCEAEVLRKLRGQFGRPLKGRETFLVCCELDGVLFMIDAVVKNYSQLVGGTLDEAKAANTAPPWRLR